MKSPLANLGSFVAGGLLVFLILAKSETPNGDRTGAAAARPERSKSKSAQLREILKSKGADREAHQELVRENEDVSALLDQLGVQVPSRAELDDYIATRNGDPEALFGASLILDSQEMAEEALRKDPNNPGLLLYLATNFDQPIAERLALAENLTQIEPDNALGFQLLAGLKWEQGDIEGALVVLRDSITLTSYKDNSSHQILAMSEALTHTGSDPIGAKLYGIQMSPTSHIFDTFTLVKNMRDHADSLSPEQANEIRYLTTHMGDRLADPNNSQPLVTNLVGLAIQKNSIANLPEDAPSQFEGITVGELDASIMARRDEIRDLNPPGAAELRKMTPQLLRGYTERLHVLGELEAVRWIRTHVAPPPREESGG